VFPSRQPALDASYTASLAALSGDCQHHGESHSRRPSCATRIERGVAWGTEVAQDVLAWRATDGFSATYPPFTGGTAVGLGNPTTIQVSGGTVIVVNVEMLSSSTSTQSFVVNTAPSPQ
jgi:hypothetical protein